MATKAGGDSGDRSDRTLTHAARVAAGVAALLAAVVLTTWFVGPDAVDLTDPGRASMKANTALACLAIAAAVLARRTPVVAVLCLAAAAIGLASLVEYLADLDVGIDELVVEDTFTRRTDAPGRMAPATAISLVLLASSRWACQVRAARVAHLLAALPLGIGVLALLGYLFRVEQFYTVVAYSTVALPTAMTIVLLALAVAALVPDGVAWWVAKDPGAGATLVRHMLPVALVGLPLLAALLLIGVSTDVFGDRFGIALMVAVAALVLLTVTAVAARRLDKIDRMRIGAQDRLRQLNEQLRERRDLEWRRAEELSRDLGDERARYSRAIGKIDDLIWTVEVLRDGTLRPEFSSGDASGLFGGAPRDATDRAREVPRLVHPDDRHLLDAFDDKVRRGQAADTEVRLVGYDGAVRWVWIRGTPRRERSQLFFDGISTNVTERRELAERRENLLALEQEQVRKLKQLNQLREELLAVTGHELRTPLAVVRGYAELLLQDSDLTEVQRKHLEVVANRSRQITLLVDDIFDLAKFSAGLANIDLQPVSLDDAVARAVADHRPAAAEAGVSIDVDVSPVTVPADPARLRQILDNLLSNAIKYSLPDGRITVSAHRDEKPSVDQGSSNGADGGAGEPLTATIVVSDGGIGIPEGELEHVFDRMYRASSAKDRDIKGTGLGLSVTKALVEAHPGTVTVVDRPEGGTRFTVTLPVERNATVTPPSPTVGPVRV